MAEVGRGVVFRSRRQPCAGDLRIAWRVSVTLLALFHSRGKKASFAKLHLLNDALQSAVARQSLIELLNDPTGVVFWQFRVEPAFNRALDFIVGEGFACWSASGDRAVLSLSFEGIGAAKAIDSTADALADERAFLKEFGLRVTETFVTRVVAAGKRLL